MKQVLGWWLPDTDKHFEIYLNKEGGQYQSVHRSTILNFLKTKINDFNNCIDVGAHVGFWSKDFTENFKHVYAFEPIPLVRDCYVKNIIKENYTLYPYGLGSESKTVNVHYDPDETGNTHVAESGNLKIEIKKIDDFELNKIDYIKIDAEGYEIEVVKGAEKLIQRDKPYIHVEMKEKVLVKQGLSKQIVDDFFKSINYEQVLKVKAEAVYAPR